MEIQSLVGRSHEIQRTTRCRNNGVSGSWSPQAFYLELKRRGVLEAGTNYIVIAWLIVQVAELIGDVLYAPEWILQTLLIALTIGLPFALVLSWAFELTPGGLKRDDECASAGHPDRRKGRGLVCALIAILVLTIGALAVNRQVSVCTAPPHASIHQADMPTNFGTGFTSDKNIPNW